ncbi:MAG: hypothetical protein QXS84_02880 [Sulfolobales archaeon]
MSIFYVRRRIKEPSPARIILIPVVIFSTVMLLGLFVALSLEGYSLRDLAPMIINENTLMSPAVIRYAVVTALLSLALLVNVSGGYVNLGAEGQIAVSSIAILVASIYDLGITGAILLSLLFVTAWSLPPYLVKIVYGGSDVLSSFIMNFIALFMANHIVSHVFRGDIARPRSPPITDIDLHYISGVGWPLSILNRISLESLLSLILAVFVIHYILMKTRLGFRLRLLGYSPRTASLSGVNVNLYIILNLLISSLLITMVALELILGSDRRVNYNEYANIGIGSVSFGLGYTSLSIALLCMGRSYSTLIYSYMIAVGYMIVFSLYGFHRLILGTAIIGLSLLSALISELILRYEVRLSRSTGLK